MPSLTQRIKASAADRAQKSRLVTNVELTGQSKFIQDVAEWEGVSFEEAQAICHGETWPIQYELCPEELELFEREVMDKCSFVEKMREEKRKHKELNGENLADDDLDDE